MLTSLGKISSYQTSNRVINIKKDDIYQKIYHIEDFQVNSPRGYH